MFSTKIAASAGRSLLFAGLAFALALGLLSGPRLALAHADVQSSSPASGATVDAGITSITITFDEEVSVDSSTAEVDGPSGAVSGASASVDRANRALMTISTPPLSGGEYTVRWTAVTEDDNATANGSFSFTVAGGAAAPATDPATDPATSGPSGAALPASGEGNTGVVLTMLAGIALALLGFGFGVLRRTRA
jgi:methionine-rich copper-binding protein CopC